MRKPKPIVVIGSINMDLVCRMQQRPAGGQTVMGTDFVTVPGGKGANQAVAAAKLGCDVHMVGRVGNDDFGMRLLAGLKQHKVNTDHVTVSEGLCSGCAMILVDSKGENSIVVVSGANYRITPADVDAAQDLIASSAAVVLQLEIPLATVSHALEMCRCFGVHTILDPAPAPRGAMPRSLYAVDVLTPNQIEAQTLLGAASSRRFSKRHIADPKQVGMELLARGARSVVLKLGSRGSMIVDRQGHMQRVKAFKVKVVDTTAAGDAFTGALAVAHAEGMELQTALRFANAAGAVCCQTFGAQPSLPTRQAVEKIMAQG